jgi:hypothetical protein
MTNQDLINGFTCLKNPQIREFINHQNRLKLLAPISKTVLTPLIEKYQSDKWVHTLFTANFISLYIFIGLTIGKSLSLRLIEAVSKSYFAGLFTGLSKGVSRSGLSDRNESIPADLFQELVLRLANQIGKSGRKIIRPEIKIFDSTFISLAHKLIPM